MSRYVARRAHHRPGLISPRCCAPARARSRHRAFARAESVDRPKERLRRSQASMPSTCAPCCRRPCCAIRRSCCRHAPSVAARRSTRRPGTQAVALQLRVQWSARARGRTSPSSPGCPPGAPAQVLGAVDDERSTGGLAHRGPPPARSRACRLAGQRIAVAVVLVRARHAQRHDLVDRRVGGVAAAEAASTDLASVRGPVSCQVPAMLEPRGRGVRRAASAPARFALVLEVAHTRAPVAAASRAAAAAPSLVVLPACCHLRSSKLERSAAPAGGVDVAVRSGPAPGWRAAALMHSWMLALSGSRWTGRPRNAASISYVQGADLGQFGLGIAARKFARLPSSRR